MVAVKGGHIIDRAPLLAGAEVVANSDVQITEYLYLAALHPDEYEAVMLYLNHSCEPKVGVAGNVVFVAMRDIAAGDEPPSTTP
ncbi:MAG: SET domain-containing protein [Candidatus Dormiibacterota bacterium]